MEKEAPHRDPSNLFDPEKAAPFLFAGGHPGWLGLTYLGHGEDWTEIRLPWREELMGDDVRRVIASGPIFSMRPLLAYLGARHDRHHLRA